MKPSCGCTAPEYDKTIKPGGEGKIVLNVDTKTFQGPISKSALILTDDPEKPQVTIFVLANVKPYIETHPVGFFRLQALTGETATSEIILSSGEADFKPTKVETPNSYIKATLAPATDAEKVAGKGANQWKVTVTTTPDAPEGLLGGYVKVTTGAAKQPDVSLAVSGYVKPTLSITPLSVNFGNFEPKADPVKRTVTIINNNLKNEAFQVTKAESNVPGSQGRGRHGRQEPCTGHHLGRRQGQEGGLRRVRHGVDDRPREEGDQDPAQGRHSLVRCTRNEDLAGRADESPPARLPFRGGTSRPDSRARVADDGVSGGPYGCRDSSAPMGRISTQSKAAASVLVSAAPGMRSFGASAQPNSKRRTLTPLFQAGPGEAVA